MNETHDRRFSRLARLTGLAYLGIIATGVVAEFVVRGSLVVTDDPVATATNIAESPVLFGLGVVADMVMIALDVTVAIGLYRLLRHVDRRLALTTTVLRLAQGAVLAVNLLNLFRALELARGAVGSDPAALVGPAQPVLDAVERHALGYDLGLVAFGLSCLVLGRLLSMSGLVSKKLAIGMSATGVVYLAGSFVAVFAPDLTPAVEPFYLVPFVVELAFALRLVRGFDPATRPASRPDAPVAA